MLSIEPSSSNFYSTDDEAMSYIHVSTGLTNHDNPFADNRDPFLTDKLSDLIGKHSTGTIGRSLSQYSD